jgi:hypothetical protein
MSIGLYMIEPPRICGLIITVLGTTSGCADEMLAYSM